MKRFVHIVIAVLAMLPQAVMAQNEEGLKVMSYNIRMGSANDGTNSWHMRYPATAEMIKDQAPDVFGVQEALDYQINFIDINFPEYKNVGVGREDGKKEGEFMSIFWNKKTGRKFYFVNTHLDHKGKEAQKNGLKLIVDRVSQINPEGYPMVLTGDFNIEPDNANLAELDSRMQSARKIAAKTDSHDTFNGWGKSSGIIDYIYVSGFSSCPEYQTVTKKYYNRKFISDHYPVSATLIF